MYFWMARFNRPERIVRKFIANANKFSDFLGAARRSSRLPRGIAMYAARLPRYFQISAFYFPEPFRAIPTISTSSAP